MKGQNIHSEVLSVDLKYLSTVNLALLLNSSPVVQSLILTNHSEMSLKGIEYKFSSLEEIIQPETHYIECLKPGEALLVKEVDIKLSYQKLSELPEALKGTLVLDVVISGEILYHQDFELTALAADQWTGSEELPEILAAFVTPNLETVTQMLASVGKELKRTTGGSSIEGYQGGPKRIYEICRAIYHVIQDCGIIYSNPASSFGLPGQKIRFADAICKNRIATCLDTTLFFASIMEACGLHPILMLQKTHAYIGCHLIDNSFSELPAYDLQKIRKLVELDKILVFETTLVTGNGSFAEAVEAAKVRHLIAENEFLYAVDIVRARNSGIKPLPIMRSIDGFRFTQAEKTFKMRNVDDTIPLIHTEVETETTASSIPQNGFFDYWSSKLLDLTLRNRLLNIGDVSTNSRGTQWVIPLACSDIAAMTHALAENEMFSLKSWDESLGAKDRQTISGKQPELFPSEFKPLLSKELSGKKLWTTLSETETKNRLTKLFRQGKINMEEGGINTIFIVLGTLEWKETLTKSYRAPILLFPVRLWRKSIAEGFSISHIGEETFVNETLLEYLRSQFQLNIAGLSPLPANDSGIDVSKVLQIFRQAVQNMSGWEVHEEVLLGLFSFGKFIMWKDMKEHAGVWIKNPVIKSLAEGTEFNDKIEVFSPEDIGRQINLKNLYCPVNADSSQLTAVLYSELGKSFVLYGPPGTGKSQTITNIIAHNLAMGKHVLFVSEKKAALDVVHKRLKEIGLHPFCLELHSNKSGKIEVLAQFKEILETFDKNNNKRPDNWNIYTKNLENLRQELNDYVTALHHHYPNGFSAYDCFTHLIQKTCNEADLLNGYNCLTQTKDEYVSLLDQINGLALARKNISPETVKALLWLDLANWNPAYERDLCNTAEVFLNHAVALKNSFSVLKELQIFPNTTDIEQIFLVAEIIPMLETFPNVPATLLKGNFSENISFLKGYFAIVNYVNTTKKRLEHYNTDEIKKLDIDGIMERIAENEHIFVFIRLIKNHFLLKELADLKKKGGKKLTVEELKEVLPLFKEWVPIRHQYEEQTEKAVPLLGFLLNEDRKIDNEKLAVIEEKVTSLTKFVSSKTEDDREFYRACIEKIYNILPCAEESFAEGTNSRKALDEFCKDAKDFCGSWNNILSYASSFRNAKDITDIENKLRFLLEHKSEIRNIMYYRARRDPAVTGLLNVWVTALEDGRISADNSENVFKTAYMQKMLDQILSCQQALSSEFNGFAHRDKIRRFCNLDDSYTSLVKQIIITKLTDKFSEIQKYLPKITTEQSILKHECSKKIRQKAVRQLLAEIPNLTAVLKPCFLMSPLSVAQYLSPDTSPFDLVVFDEASQIPVCDAIGAIARGRQLIVVGDPKQMPPTNFFQKGDNTEAEDDSESQKDDSENILEKCKEFMMTCQLNWHYRSKDESLIAFSNQHYYGNGLLTFPACSQSPTRGVCFRFVPNAVYDRGGDRDNEVEAKALVKYVVDKLKSKEDQPRRSIGIVTFNEPQKEKIEKLLEEERSKHPELDSYFNCQDDKSLFVKNLENVQGDERDVILFSICYGLGEKEKKLSKDFGPLNRAGGERRLNVAITRAKEQIIVFSSIHSTQIEIKESDSVGVKHLKEFLEYAEKNTQISMVKEDNDRIEGTPWLVAEFLKTKGYEFDCNVGRAKCRIDIAVRNPDKPDEYLLGIECDGPSYAEQRTVRDRDHLRLSVLQSLGWRIWKAWTVEWKYDRASAEASLLKELETARHAGNRPV